MGFIEAALLLLFLAVLSAPLADRLRIPSEILLLLGSLALSFVPGVPELELEPDVVFRVFLPPILFSGAYFTSWRDFKANRRAISLLAVGLVLFTLLSVAAVAHALIPSLSWPESFLLGAIVSPPDASAAVSIVRKLGVPRRLVTVIEGESLINDATALVAYRFALGTLLTGGFSFPRAVGQFILAGGGGALTGLLLARGAILMSRRLGDARAESVLSILTAFGCYLVAERLGLSGVVSTVAGGLYYGRKLASVTSGRTRMEAHAAWDVLLFGVDGLVFALIGLQMPRVLKGLSAYGAGELLAYGAGVSLAVMLVRILWVFPAAYLPRWLIASVRKSDPAPSWRIVAALSWTGMRGIVSLAAALALPREVAEGRVFAQRDLLIFVTYCVILSTLVVPSLTLPALLRVLGLKEEGEAAREEALARIASTRAALERVFAWESGSNPYPSELARRFREHFERRLRVIESHLEDNPFSGLLDEDRSIRRMTRETIEAERRALHELRARGAIHDEVFHALTEELDIEELRLRSHRI